MSYTVPTILEDDHAVLKQAIKEALEPILSGVKDVIGQVLREVIHEEMPQALSPLMARLERTPSKSRNGRSSHNFDETSPTESLFPLRSGSNRSMENSKDLGVKVDSKIFRRLSAPMQIARVASSVHRAAQRLKRSSHVSPEGSEDFGAERQAEDVSVPVRRLVPALSSGASRPLGQLLREDSSLPGKIPNFLRGADVGIDSERIETLELAESSRQAIKDLQQSSGFLTEEERPHAPEGEEPRLPGAPQHGAASPVDFADIQRQTSSSLEEESAESTRDREERRSQQRGPLREMNSLEIVPSFTASESKPVSPPLSHRIAAFFARWMPRRAQSRLGRFATKESFQGRMPSKPQQLDNARSVRPRRSGRRHRTTSFFEVKTRRRTAVVLEPAVIEDLRRKTARSFWRSWKWPFRDPNGRPRQCWDLLACILLALQLLYLPFQSAFITPEDLEDAVVHTFSSCLITIDIFWAVDLVVNFTTGYRDSVQVLHTDTMSKVSHYLKSWFLVDLLATFPSLLMHILLLIYGSNIARQLFWLTLSPLIRSPRLYAQLSMLRRMEAHLKSSWLSSVAALLELFMLPVMFSHLSACALWALGRSNLEADPSVSSWIKMGIDLTNDPGALQAVPIGERYMTALYFAVTVMSTVGLGDINMDLVNERGLLCLIMATTSLVVGVAVNGVAAIVAKLNERTAVTNEQLAKVSRFLKAYNVPGDLQRRVHSYLLQFFENQEREDTKSSLMVWLKKSETLRVNMNLALTGTCLARHHLIRLVPRDVLVNVCDICDMEFHPPGEELAQAGSEVKSCFYIRRGEVQTCVPENEETNRTGNVLAKDPAREGTAEFTTLFHTDGTAPPPDDIDEIQREIEATDRKRPGQQYREGSFIGDFRLFLGISRSSKTATCTSFCELIAVDVEKFRNLMIAQAPEIFDMLVIYSSIDNDCPQVLLRILEEQFLCPEDALLFGEGALHHCAKKNAYHCADHLLDELSADVAVLDTQGKTPSQIAAKLNHKEVFWSIIKHAGMATDEEVLPMEAYAMRTKNQRRVKASASLNSSAFDEIEQETQIRSSMEVREILQVNGYSCAEWDREGRKSVDMLVEELNTCRSRLMVSAGKHLVRRVELVRLRLLAVVDDHARALVELQTDPWMRSEQKLAKLPCRRILLSQTVEEAFEALLVELGVPAELIEEKLLVTLASGTYNEVKPSMSFPGLDTEYIVHEQTMKIRSQAVHRATAIGLPQGEAFQKELPVSPLTCVTRQFFWPVLVKMRFGKHADPAKTEELKRKHSERKFEEDESGFGLSRFNPLRFSLMKKNSNVVDVGAR
ncbi:unnamed protein product [Cladocopium goreaui]|uniref:Potassium voltage-gated channel subfamily H member 7 n=1 Tax=Cladocopium goreaui TaxID=2562237 RepID=A0A9P1FPE5_9DINO|nr:unnamed protein product [Cladocopium goreaui]